MINDDFIWLLQWFSNQCNGDWEHEYGVRIGTLDNPGWRLRISLIGTKLEGRKFERIAIERSEKDWLFCFIEKGHFESACGLYNLPEALKIFRIWAET
ncbi:MAG: immunity 53 family protein [Chlamydiales bacterium]|nr:immunity 53 family protein [Chlamydiales bacterium]